jgi:hypothetical protein
MYEVYNAHMPKRRLTQSEAQTHDEQVVSVVEVDTIGGGWTQ